MERFKKPISDSLQKALDALYPGTFEEILKRKVGVQDLETPPDRNLGDFAFPCFRLSKALKKAPPQIAQELVAKVIAPEGMEVKQAGPYVNFACTPKALIQGVLKDVLNETPQHRYGGLPKNSREKWVFEYSSPNVAKPFQIYHLRTTIVGAALSRMARLRGFDVTTINHLGDWGTQYGKLAVALKRYANELPQELTLKDLVDVYVRIHKDMEADPEIEKTAQAAFLKLEQGDAEMLAIWKKCVDISMREFKKVYARFNVEFDHYWGESFYESQLKPLLADLKAKKILIEDQGAWIVPVTTRAGGEIPPCILEKRDGATIYATRDVAAALYRKKELKFEHMTYIVGKEQILHFEQVFGVLRAMGLSWEPQCEHLPTGLYRFKDAKMSTRKGNFVTLEEVLEMCSDVALKLMKERNATLDPEARLSDADISTIADQVSVGAIVFADLSTDPTRDLDFDVNRIISFEGETGPYLQYAHTRCESILRRLEQDKEMKAAFNLGGEIIIPLETKLTTSFELNLVRTLGRFPETLEKTLDQRKPSQLATYLINLSNDYNSFYRECKVLDPNDTAMSAARIQLVRATQTVLAHGLDLLGIPKPHKM